MGRPATGQVIERDGRRGRAFVIRFRAYGRRHHLTVGNSADGWTRQRAEDELANVLADVRRGIWRPPRDEPAPEPARDPTFHEFASEWWEAKKRELRPNTVAAYEWEICGLLLPFFAGHRLSEITVREVDRFKTAKVREREAGARLSNASINKALGRLAQILEDAVEYGLIPSNPARGRRRRLKAARPRRAWLEPEQVGALLRAAGELDRDGRVGGRRPLLATLALAGLRVGEALALRWRDVDLAAGRLTVGESKTHAGLRTVDLSPDLRDELATHKAGAVYARPADLVFPTARGTLQNRHNVRERILRGAVRLANEDLIERGLAPIAETVSPHTLRHTAASLLLETGATVTYVMGQLGHADPKVTLGIYAHVLDGGRRPGVDLDALIVRSTGSDGAPSGTAPPPRVSGSLTPRGG